MANYGKRMVPEYLVKGLEEAYTKTSGGTGSTINLMENIVDSKGNKRFVEGAFTPYAIEKVTYTYCKWSLSGSHLMIVLAGNCESGAVFSNKDWSNITLPTWILDKIYPTVNSVIDNKTMLLRKINEWWTSQSIGLTLQKYAGRLMIRIESNVTSNSDSAFRIQFDLLIDND